MICNICGKNTGTLFKRSKEEYENADLGYGMDCHTNNVEFAGNDGHNGKKNNYEYPDNVIRFS